MASMTKTKIKKGDHVMVTSGRHRGKSGKILKVQPTEGRVFVERLNIVKRHQKASGPQSPGGIIEKEAPLALSNVMIVCEKCSRPVRVGRRRLEDGRRVRYCRRCQEQVDQ